MVRELADACRRGGLLFGAYYSILDWYHPDYPLGSPAGKTKKPAADMDRYTAFLKNQVAELVRGYGPLGVLWFDGEWEEPWTDARGSDLYAFLRRLQPSLIVNNRVAKARKGMEGTSAPQQFSGDYDTPEQRIGGFTMDRPWETCMTICQQWSWKPDDRMKSLDESLRTLVATAGGNGNLLFNVGPMPDGRDRTAPGRPARGDGRMAGPERRGDLRHARRTVHAWRVGRLDKARQPGLHPRVCLGRRDVAAPGASRRVVSARRLSGGPVEMAQDSSGIALRVPQALQDPVDTLIVLELDRPAMGLAPVPAPPVKGR